jgi:hypothetical protein
MWPLVGGLVGFVNGLTRWTTISYLSSDAITRSLALVLGGMVVRLGFVTGLLIAGLKQGIDAGLLAFAGLWVTRWIIVIWSNARQDLRNQRSAKQAGD